MKILVGSQIFFNFLSQKCKINVELIGDSELLELRLCLNLKSEAFFEFFVDFVAQLRLKMT